MTDELLPRKRWDSPGVLLNWPREILERDHRIQNPSSPDKIRLLGAYTRLRPESRVLDIACGQAGPAMILAEEYGCSILGIELRTGFVDEANRRIAARGLETRIEVECRDAKTFRLESEAWDVGLCLGAAFVWGNIADASAALTPAVRPHGFVAIGEPFWRQWPAPEGIDPEDFVGLEETVRRFESGGLVTTAIIAGSEDDWDRYRSLQWRAIHEWLASHADEPGAAEIQENHNKVQGGLPQVRAIAARVGDIRWLEDSGESRRRSVRQQL
jgi:SAM-dependent methyltransferase